MSDRQPVTPQTFASAFIHNPAGAAVLDALRRRFHDISTFDADPHVHAHKAGSRDVLVYILNMLAQAERPPKREED